MRANVPPPATDKSRPIPHPDWIAAQPQTRLRIPLSCHATPPSAGINGVAKAIAPCVLSLSCRTMRDLVSLEVVSRASFAFHAIPAPFSLGRGQGRCLIGDRNLSIHSAQRKLANP